MIRPLLLPVLLLLTGCSLSKPVPDGDQFMLDVAPAAVAPSRPAGTVTVQVARVVAPFSERRFLYRMGTDKYEADPYNGFIAAPSAMITDATIRWLSERGPFRTVVGEGLALDGPYRLQQLVQTLSAEFLPGTTQAVVEIRFLLTSERSGTTEVFLDRTYRAVAPLTDGKPATIAAGLNAALTDVLTQFTADLQHLRE